MFHRKQLKSANGVADSRRTDNWNTRLRHTLVQRESPTSTAGLFPSWLADQPAARRPWFVSSASRSQHIAGRLWQALSHICTARSTCREASQGTVKPKPSFHSLTEAITWIYYIFKDELLYFSPLQLCVSLIAARAFFFSLIAKHRVSFPF